MDITTFTSKFDGGARSNLFSIQIANTPAGVPLLGKEDHPYQGNSITRNYSW